MRNEMKIKVTTVYVDCAAPASGSRATVENSDTARREPVFFSADVKARNALWTSDLASPTEPDSSSTRLMSMPHAFVRSGFAIGS